jgi:hypothetical protein
VDGVQEAFCGRFRSWDRLPDDTNVPAGAQLPQAAGYREPEHALRTASQVAW